MDGRLGIGCLFAKEVGRWFVWGFGKIPGIELASCVEVVNGASRQLCCAWAQKGQKSS
jgi:hypothetical protein